MAFKIASSPHVSQGIQTATVMRRVALCLIPGILVQTLFFGFGSLIQLCLAIFTAYLGEALVLKARGRPILITLKDNSALVTASLLALSIPPLAPWWLVVIGSLFAIIIVKHLYGGLGHNLFNPAMAGYVVLLVSFPLQMTSWVAPQGIALNGVDALAAIKAIFAIGSSLGNDFYRLGVDGIAMATPLDTIKTDLSLGLTTLESFAKPIFDGSYGVGWFWVNLAYLAGGLVLLKLKVIRWHISVGILAALFVCASFGFLISPDTHVSPLFHWFSGGTMLAVFFIATDPVTAATSPRGRLIFGASIGIIIYLIRTYGGYPDAVAFAVLLANMCAPFIDHYVRPRTYGHRSAN
jgi:Na+-translocating ferredoxin:NAD+ oxidoreductase subunit D